MIERIDVFMPPQSPYELLRYFTLQLAAALQRTGVRCRVLEAQRDNPEVFLKALFDDRPECTLSFNGLLPDTSGHFLCDLIQIPHVACLVDAPHHFLALTHSPYSIITTNDWQALDFFEGMNFQKILFMPLGVDINLAGQTLEYSDEKRPYDVLMLSTFIDYEGIRKAWREQLSKSLYTALEEAAEIILSDSTISYAQGFAQAIDQQMKSSPDLDPHKIDVIALLGQLERYVNGRDRVELIKSLKDVNLHIYGNGSQQWKKLLVNQPNAAVHDPVEYEQALKLMQQSKIVLSSRASLRRGMHERVLAGIACGALVVSNENSYMKEIFPNEEGVVFYRPKQWDQVYSSIHGYLSNPEKRFAKVASGRKIIKEGYTWDHCAASLVSELGTLLESLS